MTREEKLASLFIRESGDLTTRYVTKGMLAIAGWEDRHGHIYKVTTPCNQCGKCCMDKTPENHFMPVDPKTGWCIHLYRGKDPVTKEWKYSCHSLEAGFGPPVCMKPALAWPGCVMKVVEL